MNNITFEAYDFADKNFNLNQYEINSIKISHTEDEITFEGGKDKLYLILGLFFKKIETLDEIKLNFITLVSLFPFEEIHDLDLIKTYENFKNKNEDYFVFKIISSMGTLEEEKGILVYYNDPDMYHDELLDEIIRQYKKK